MTNGPEVRASQVKWVQFGVVWQRCWHARAFSMSDAPEAGTSVGDPSESHAPLTMLGHPDATVMSVSMHVGGGGCNGGGRVGGDGGGNGLVTVSKPPSVQIFPLLHVKFPFPSELPSTRSEVVTGLAFVRLPVQPVWHVSGW